MQFESRNQFVSNSPPHRSLCIHRSDPVSIEDAHRIRPIPSGSNRIPSECIQQCNSNSEPIRPRINLQRFVPPPGRIPSPPGRDQTARGAIDHSDPKPMQSNWDCSMIESVIDDHDWKRWLIFDRHLCFWSRENSNETSVTRPEEGGLQKFFFLFF